MKKRVLSFVSIFVLLSVRLIAQPLANPIAAALDVSSNIYVITEQQNLVKYNSKGDSLKAVSVAQYGVDAMIDAGNQLEIMVFFPINGRIVVFDNQLNLIWTCELFDNQPNLQPSAFGRAADGNIWLIDKSSRTLKKIDKQGNKTMESLLLMDYNYSDTIQAIKDQGTAVLFGNGQNRIWQYSQSLALVKSEMLLHQKLLAFEGNHFVYINNLGKITKIETSGYFWKEIETKSFEGKTIFAANLNHCLTGKKELGLKVE